MKARAPGEEAFESGVGADECGGGAGSEPRSGVRASRAVGADFAMPDKCFYEVPRDLGLAFLIVSPPWRSGEVAGGQDTTESKAGM